MPETTAGDDPYVRMTLGVYRVTGSGQRTVVRPRRAVQPVEPPRHGSALWPPCACPRHAEPAPARTPAPTGL